MPGGRSSGTETETGIGRPQGHVDIDTGMQAGTGNADRVTQGMLFIRVEIMIHAADKICAKIPENSLLNAVRGRVVRSGRYFTGPWSFWMMSSRSLILFPGWAGSV